MALEFNYDEIVRRHDAVLDALRNRLDQISQVKSHAEQAGKAADGMAAQQGELAAAAQHLIDMMGTARFDARSLAGCEDAVNAFSRADAHEVEEQAAAVVDTVTEVGDLTADAADDVQTSQAHIVGTYGPLAEGVQSTGVRGEALEAVGA